MIKISKIGASKHGNFLNKAVLYFAIGVLVIISFFPMLQRAVPNNGDPYLRTDNSLLALMIDKLFDAEDSATDTSDNNTDDDSDSTDLFTALVNSSTLNKIFFVELKKIQKDNSFPDSPPLKRFTPPPRA